MRIICLIQARENSTRLPGKVSMDIGGWTMLKHVTMRASKIGGLEGVRVITPEEFDCDENDVLGRYYLAGKGYDAVMRITADCPLLDPAACRRALDVFQSGHYDYVALRRDGLTRYPDGLGCEVFLFPALECAHQNADKAYDREHVTAFIRGRSRDFVCHPLACPVNGAGGLKLSVDTMEDLTRVRAIDAAGPRDFGLEATLEALGRVKAKA